MVREIISTVTLLSQQFSFMPYSKSKLPEQEHIISVFYYNAIPSQKLTQLSRQDVLAAQ